MTTKINNHIDNDIDSDIDSDSDIDINNTNLSNKYLNNINDNDNYDEEEPVYNYDEKNNEYTIENNNDYIDKSLYSNNYNESKNEQQNIKDIDDDQYDNNEYNSDDSGSGSDSDSDDEEDYEDNDDDLKKLNAIDINYLEENHPECKAVNNNEIDILSKITYDSAGNIIDPFHKTAPFVTAYEKTRIIGIRTKLLENGQASYITNLPDNIIDNYIIANMEFEQKLLPYIIKRPLPNGSFEYWRLKDLEILNR